MVIDLHNLAEDRVLLHFVILVPKRLKLEKKLRKHVKSEFMCDELDLEEDGREDKK
ncbi:hypothetical protein YC2023_109594 [Brassica napus]